jgi:hypothetical protein
MTNNKIEYADLAKDGLILDPPDLSLTQKGPFWADTAKQFLDCNRDQPEIIGFVPNLHAFAVGPDYNAGAFEIKGQNSDIVCLPSSLGHLLPATAIIIDDFYRHAGKRAAGQCHISLQFFRSDTKRGDHLLFDKIHRHVLEGKMVIYVATAIDPGEKLNKNLLGTEYYAPEVLGKRISRAKLATSAEDFQQKFEELGVVEAPGGAIIRFSENTLHAAPDVTHPLALQSSIFGAFGGQKLRRSLINIIASTNDENGLIYGRTRPPNPHRASPVENIVERQSEYRAAARVLLEHSGASIFA